ncbi:MAG: DUF4876 domain-containing protein [Muribaculum sp.]|nr:DUF4876 domain-containing protein [Muribaculum sp.]
MKKANLKSWMIMGAVCGTFAFSATSCKDDENSITYYDVTVDEVLPPEVPSNATVQSGQLTFTELNTKEVYVKALPIVGELNIPAGTYNVEGNMTVTYSEDGTDVERSFRSVANNVVISSNTPLNLKWFYYNPDNTLVFGEIYITGTLNADGKNGLYDVYFTIYNNTDEVLYADGLAICESKILNTADYEIVSQDNLIDRNFTAGAVYVIPGNGTDVPVQPGQSIKIADQAIDWTESVAGALDLTNADFEWYDEVTTGSVRDTDNPSVPNLDKWYSYSNTIWIPSKQCNRSYALVRFPEGMTAERFVDEQASNYTYLGATGKEMTDNKNKLIKYEWILDGVNLCPTEVWKRNTLSATVDMSYAAISDKNSDVSRFGKKFARKVAGTSSAGNVILQDTNDSANDFDVVPVK